MYAANTPFGQGLAYANDALYNGFMIVRSRPTYMALLFAVRGSVLPLVAGRLVIILLVSCLAVGLHHVWPHYLGVPIAAPFTLLGLGLSIFMGFRNNACYDRWWEGRKQWGALVAASRNILRDITALLPDSDPFRRQAAHFIGSFARHLRDQLRDKCPHSTDKSGRLLAEIADQLGQRLRAGEISDITYRLFSDHLSQMADVQAACERLKSAPVPFAYSLMLHRSVWLFCLALPFGLVDILDFGTPFITLVLAYSFLGLDALGEELEYPFSTAPNSLPLDAMTRTIEIAVAHALHEPAPPPLQPQNYVLL